MDNSRYHLFFIITSILQLSWRDSFTWNNALLLQQREAITWTWDMTVALMDLLLVRLMQPLLARAEPVCSLLLVSRCGCSFWFFSVWRACICPHSRSMACLWSWAFRWVPLAPRLVPPLAPYHSLWFFSGYPQSSFGCCGQGFFNVWDGTVLGINSSLLLLGPTKKTAQTRYYWPKSCWDHCYLRFKVQAHFISHVLH